MDVKLPEKKYYRIGEIAAAFELNVSHIRFWEKEFDIIKPKKNKKGDRLFTSKDVENLQLIHHLVKEKGLTLEGAKARLKQKQEVLDTNKFILAKLEKVKAELLKIKGELD
jgi:DNA-binding transcriptional MerR regulator